MAAVLDDFPVVAPVSDEEVAVAVRAVVKHAPARWLRLVAADAELAPYLVGVDRARLAGHLALTLTVALGVPVGAVVAARRAFADEAGS
jgi:hemoglobin